MIVSPSTARKHAAFDGGGIEDTMVWEEISGDERVPRQVPQVEPSNHRVREVWCRGVEDVHDIDDSPLQAPSVREADRDFVGQLRVDFDAVPAVGARQEAEQRVGLTEPEGLARIDRRVDECRFGIVDVSGNPSASEL